MNQSRDIVMNHKLHALFATLQFSALGLAAACDPDSAELEADRTSPQAGPEGTPLERSARRRR